ncbi:MAG: DNA-3-methyladenine glycosylase I [Dehalococcoidales bacterium]
MIKSIFQTGISWQVEENKWPDIKQVLRDFDPETIAHFTFRDVDRFVKDKRVIRNRRKLEAIVFDARRLLELDNEYGDFEATVKDLRKQFKFLGETGSYHFLYVVGKEVSPYQDWAASRGVKQFPSPH